MIDKILIERKLGNIEEFLKELDAAKVDNLEEFQSNVMARRFIERNIELAIEQMIDICRHLVSGLDLKEPENYAECFDILSAEGVIRREDTQRFQAMARFRNMLIHVYDGIDNAITYGIYKDNLSDFTLFISTIRGFLHRKEKPTPPRCK
jgi:uncharacterized protein YutE (UPF0331/DUF86 family)